MNPSTDQPTTEQGGPLLVQREGRVLHLELHRPHSLNALNHPMVKALRAEITAASSDPEVDVVVLSGAGERAFSAGGDLKFLHTDATGTGADALPFWADLYGVVADIDACAKPVVALMDGFVLGGGCGIAGNCPVRVVTERATLGMPETRIGFYPDTGGLSMLQKLTGEVGTYLGTCSQSVNGVDAIAVGLADHFVPSSDLPAFVEAIVTLGLDEALAAFAAVPTEEPTLPAAWVDECFAGDDPVAILDRLRAHEHPDAQAAAELYASRSPAAVAVTLKALRVVADLTLAEDLALELRMTDRLRQSADFIEGVRARLVDKDRNPSWALADVSEVSPEWVDQIVL